MLYLTVGLAGCDGAKDGVSSADPAIGVNQAGGAMPVVRTFVEPSWPTPDTYTRGRFAIANGCLVFVDEQGTSFSPVLPNGTELAKANGSTGELRLRDGSVVRLGTDLRVKGGESEYGRAPIPPTCPQRTLAIGDLRL